MIEDNDYFKGISETPIQLNLDSNTFLTIKGLAKALVSIRERLELFDEVSYEIRWVDPLTFDGGCG